MSTRRIKGDRPLIRAIGKLRDPRESPWIDAGKNEKHVLHILLGYADIKTGRCYPTQKQLATDTSSSRATVNRALRNLEEMGYITRLRRGRTGRATDIKINYSALESNYRGQSSADTDCGLKVYQNEIGVRQGETRVYQGETPTNHITNHIKNHLSQPELIERMKKIGIEERQAEKLIQVHDPIACTNAAQRLDAWHEKPDKPYGAFQHELKSVSRDYLAIPKFPDDPDARKLQSWATRNGLPPARRGELPADYRSRVEDEFRELQNKGGDRGRCLGGVAQPIKRGR